MICPNCKNEVSAEADICPLCGANLKGKTNTPKTGFSLDSNNLKKGIIVLALAVVGIIVMLAFRAWLGVPIYTIAAVIAIMHLRSEAEANGGALGDFIKDCLKNGDIGLKLMTVVVMLLPVVLIVGTIFYIYVDTERRVNAMFSMISYTNFFKFK